MNMKKSFLLLCGCLAIASACCNRPAKTAGINYAYMDTTARPGDDFAKYATGHWADLNPQPLEYPMWGTVAKVSDENVKALAELIKDIAAQQNEKGSIAQKIGDLYSMMMDSTRLNAEGAAPIKAHIAELDAISTREELLSRCAKEHDDLLFSVYISADEKDADNNIVCVSQSGLSLGENIADHGGLNVAYDAFQMWQKAHGKLSEDNGFTPEQRFFLSYANVWAGTASEEIMRYLTMMDVHSIDRLRINGALAQCDYWYDAFGVQPTDSLYVKPEDRVRIW